MALSRSSRVGVAPISCSKVDLFITQNEGTSWSNLAVSQPNSGVVAKHAAVSRLDQPAISASERRQIASRQLDAAGEVADARLHRGRVGTGREPQRHVVDAPVAGEALGRSRLELIRTPRIAVAVIVENAG